MGKMPFFPFYPHDWLYDTRICTNDEKAVLIDLLCFMWNAPSRGTLSGHAQDLARMVGMQWLDFEVVINALQRKNILDVTNSNGDVTLVSRRMVRDENKRESSKDRQAKHRNEKKKCDSNANVTGKKSEVRSHITPVVPKIGDVQFEQFWKTYPRRVGKGAARKMWDRMPAVQLDVILAAVVQQAKSDQWQRDGGQYIPHPATWLHQQRWLDEPIKSKETITNNYDAKTLSDKQAEMERLRDREYAKRLKSGGVPKGEQPPWKPPFADFKLKTGEDIKDAPIT